VHVNDNIAEVINDKLIFAGDVSNYDRSMTEEMIDTLHDVMEEFWDHRLVTLSRSLYYSAYYSRPLEPSGEFGFVGDFTNYREKQVVCGNRSGHAFTSLVAKVVKVAETLWLFDEMGYDAIVNMQHILEGKLPVGVVNNGDDEVVWFQNESDHKKFVQLRTSHPDVMFKVEAEVGQVYSGRVLQRESKDSRVYIPVDRMDTAFQKIYVPERSIGGTIRPYWHIGLLQRINARHRHPVVAQLWDIHDWSYRKWLEPKLGSLTNIVARAMDANPLNTSEFTTSDFEVLDDPSKLHYKYKADDIHPMVLAKAVKQLEIQVFERFYADYYTGSLM
jgi:hypothetical protein